MGSEPISLRGLMLLQSALAAQLGWRTAAHQSGSVPTGMELGVVEIQQVHPLGVPFGWTERVDLRDLPHAGGSASS